MPRGSVVAVFVAFLALPLWLRVRILPRLRDLCFVACARVSDGMASCCCTDVPSLGFVSFASLRRLLCLWLSLGLTAASLARCYLLQLCASFATAVVVLGGGIRTLVAVPVSSLAAVWVAVWTTLPLRARLGWPRGHLLGGRGDCPLLWGWSRRCGSCPHDRWRVFLPRWMMVSL